MHFDLHCLLYQEERGVGVVSAVGSNVTTVQQGDWVIPATPSLGKSGCMCTVIPQISHLRSLENSSC